LYNSTNKKTLGKKGIFFRDFLTKKDEFTTDKYFFEENEKGKKNKK
jgi:hypothetical protein